MATILYAWELGGGLGHTMRFRPLADKLIGRGHRVIAALRELRNADAAFGGRGRHPYGDDQARTACPTHDSPPHHSLLYLPAPHLTWKDFPPVETVRAYEDMLYNVGFARVEDLRVLTRAWRALFDLAKPDLLLCDHSPTALLAASLDGIRTAVIGTGFCCPPVVDGNLPVLRPWLEGVKPASRRLEEGVEVAAAHQTGGTPALRGVEDRVETPRLGHRVLANVNAILEEAGKPAFERLGELYSSAGETFLTTFSELGSFR